MNDICLIVFSYNRPLQLDAMLRSFQLRCENDINKFVLYKCDEKYNDAYRTVFKEHPYVTFVRESDFKKDLLSLIDGYEYAVFSTDDSIYINEFDLIDCMMAIDETPNSIGFSLRLSEDTYYCYSSDIRQDIPYLNYIGREIGYYDWTQFYWDFAYPLEISSSIYKVSTIENILYYQMYNNPNSLEWQMYLNTPFMKEDKCQLLCFKNSRAFSSPMNRVQKENSVNRFSENEKYSEENLLKLFMEGYRIDLDKFKGFIPNSVHQEVEFEFCKS